VQAAILQSTHRPSLFELPSSTVVSRLVPMASHNLAHFVFFFYWPSLLLRYAAILSFPG